MEQLENIIFSLSDENIGAAIQSTLNLYDVRFSFSYNLIVSQLVYSSFVSFVNNESRCFLYLIGINEKEKEKKKIINIFYWYLLRLQSQESKFLLEKMLEQNMIDEIEKKNDNSFSHQNLSDQTNKSKNTQKSSKDESELNKKQTHEGVNQSIVAKAIRNDEIEKLQEISTETNFNFNQIIEPSHYEKCTYVNKENVSLIDYAAFFGSIKCFKYLLLNNSNIANAGKYAIAGGNSEIIHLCEQNHSSFEDAYEIAIEFHRNDIFHYLYENNIIEIKDKIKLGKKCIKYNNYELFSFLEKEGMKINDSLINEAARNGNIFLTLCFLEENKLPDNILVSSAESGNIELFKYILEQEGIDINVKNVFLMNINFISLISC